MTKVAASHWHPFFGPWYQSGIVRLRLMSKLYDPLGRSLFPEDEEEVWIKCTICQRTQAGEGMSPFLASFVLLPHVFVLSSLWDISVVYMCWENGLEGGSYALWLSADTNRN